MVFKVFVRNVIVTGKKHHKLGISSYENTIVRGSGWLNKKQCSKCKKYLSANTDYFQRDSRAKDGLDYMCKSCKKIERKRWDKPLTSEQKRRQAQYTRKYIHLNREKHNASQQRRRSFQKQLKADLTAGEWEECLRFFKHRDAYTGLPLTHTSQDHVIPVTYGGAYTKHNIVPCNRDINSSKGNNNMLQWYRQQIYFDEQRLKKILQWMGDYKKYLYVPLEQMKYMEFEDKNSLQYYKVTLPNGKTKNVYYTNLKNKAKLTMLIKLYLLKDWEDYCNDHWLWFGKFDPYQWNYEDRVKNFLSRCADFILIGNLKRGNIMTDDKRDQIYQNETPLSSTSTEVNDLFFSSASNKEYTKQSKNRNIILDNEILSGNIDADFKVKIHSKRLPIVMKRYRDSQCYKIKQLYKTDDVQVNKLYKLKNKDIQYRIYNLRAPEIITEQTWFQKRDNMDKKEYKKLANKPFRNLHGENLYEYRPHTIKGNKKGIIDRSKPYKWEWSYVWADNVFEFDGSKYRIDDSVEQYQGKLTKMNRKKVPDMEVRYEMDKILIFEQDGQRYYFDQKINRLDNNLIHAI